MMCNFNVQSERCVQRDDLRGWCFRNKLYDGYVEPAFDNDDLFNRWQIELGRCIALLLLTSSSMLYRI